jgi:two-component system, chemotaxis family, CheB/CheR fusion protein
MPQTNRHTRYDADAVYPTAAAARARVHRTARGCEEAVATEAPTVFVVDDDPAIRETMRELLEEHEYVVECFADGAAFLKSYRAGRRGCLLVDALMPVMDGIELVEHLKRNRIELPAIMMSGQSNLRMAVHAMKSGAVDFVEKPFRCGVLLEAIGSAFERAEATFALSDLRKAAAARMASLTRRQRQILDLVLAGHPSKTIASELHISQRTVDNHRATIARKTCSKSLPALIQTALWANGSAGAQSHS